MKTSLYLVIVIVTLATAGCSSTPKVVRTFQSLMTYTLGQEPQKVEYGNQGKIWRENAKAEQADRLEHQRKMKQLEYMAAEQAFAATNGIHLAPQAAPPSPSAPAPRPQSQLQRGSTTRRTTAGLQGGWGTYPDRSLRGQFSLFTGGLRAFLLPHSQAGRERGVVTSFIAYPSAPAARVSATAIASGRVNLGGQPRLTQKALEHARSVNPNFDRDQRVGVGGRTYEADIFVLGGAEYRSAGTPGRPPIR